MKPKYIFSLVIIIIIVLAIITIFIGSRANKQLPEQSPQQTANAKPLFGTMLAFNINDVAMDMPGKTDALQKGWTEFKKDNSAYENLKSNLKKLIQDRAKLVEETGFSVDREIVGYFTWNVIEPQKGQFDWELTDIYVKGASNAGIKISAVVQPFASWDQKNTPAITGCNALDFAYYDYKASPPNDLAEYKNFLTKTVERYKDSVAIWEIGNEYEGQCGGYQNNPEGYLKLLKISYGIIKEIDPEAKVLNGGALEFLDDSIKNFWTKFFQLGGGQYLDYFNVHYNIERISNAKLNPATFQEVLAFYNNLMDKNGGKKPLYLTEFGIYSGSPSAQPFGQFAQGQLPSINQQGPQNDNTYFTISSDGKNWQPGSLVVKEASVPDVIQLQKNVGNFKKGDLLIYFVDFSTVNKPADVETLGLIISTDGGKIWGQKTTVSIKNKSNKGSVVDPSVVQLSDGTLRLYFFGSEITSGDPAGATGPHKVYSAVSSDGINFTVENGIRFQDDKLTDPEVIQYKNQWFMYYSVGTATKLAVSNDGLNFSARAITGGDIGGVPGAVIFDGSVRLFGCRKGIATAVASNGINFNKEQEDIFSGKIQGIVCDPSVARMDNGEYAMVYKTREEQLSNQSPQQTVLPTQPAPTGQSPIQSANDPCGDNICDDFEKQNQNVCPQDCGGSVLSGSPAQSLGQPSPEQIPNQNIQPNQGQALRNLSENDQAVLYFKYSILAFANGVKMVFIDLIGSGNNTVGSSMAFNTDGQPRLFLTTLKTIESKIGGFSKVEKIANSQYKFTVSDKTIYALWSGTLPNEISGQVKVTDIKGQEQIMDATKIKLSSDQSIFVELQRQ
ncbi:beta-galactosidase [Patescibacteria group bacterium]|nr:beta-galactosidase [Patescibacteria group bacterium]MBU4274782.1 beta-galactosidase [Patescibacteria group bacterium]MBU4367500.1 beta-galactosidase [Patescibacteria group bacterium]MBU4462196.1 beta-galactosidase [Patescibacteria group bacterium]MCG2699645.1 beta-galactosidase [Candidatus Parcubacteria bacterium]